MVVFFRTIILYLIVIIVMRIMGKRQIGELQPFELVIAIMLSALAAVPMQDTGIPLIHGIIPIVTLMVLQLLLSYLSLKFEGIRRLLCGLPSILIQQGKVNESEMRKQRFNLTDLMEELRIQGYLNISDIEYAILENSGKVSVIPKSAMTPTTKQDLNINSSEPKLPIGIILDGKLNIENLKISQHDEKWLKQQLKKNNIKNYNEVFIAMFDTNGQLFIQKR